MLHHATLTEHAPTGGSLIESQIQRHREYQCASIAIPFTKAANPDKRHEVEDGAARIPFAHRIPDVIRNHFVAMCAEYVGTVLFLYFALGGTQVANNIPTSSGESVKQVGSNPEQLQYIALCFGFSLAVNAWVFFRISGGLFNPAVTFGMCLIGALPWVRGVLLFVVQILGGMTAAALVSCMFPGQLDVQTTLGGGTTVVQGLFIEMILTAELVFTIFMLAAEKHRGTFIAPVGIGLALFVAELVGVYFTGGSLNPARSFGPAVVNHNFHGYHWIYWVGPLLGAIVASGFYKFIKILEYETVNPDQDTDKSKDERPQTSQSFEGRHSYEDFAHNETKSVPENDAHGALQPPSSTQIGTATGNGHAGDGVRKLNKAPVTRLERTCCTHIHASA
ncbi:aquaporin-2-like [Lecanosticta acicola]|uniref:Aquaporin-2-like, partial n=1 Tax=Lecanosticta acicola TaxID=111012 RepID=A0AAI9EFC9_9PEZI|nr:aquaporin-2-like [Lecanosticta acicola]